MLLEISSGVRLRRHGWRVGREIAGQYGSYGNHKQQVFGRIDPFCLFAVLPMLSIAGLVLWGGIVVLGLALIVLALLIVMADAWANRPTGRPASRYREDY